jgi:hypothetical protein
MAEINGGFGGAHCQRRVSNSERDTLRSIILSKRVMYQMEHIMVSSLPPISVEGLMFKYTGCLSCIISGNEFFHVYPLDVSERSTN